MSEVKRYDGRVSHVGDGNYVSYKDYAEIKAQRDALAAENAALREFMLEHCVVECDDGYGVIELPAEGFFPRTINTDAYLNSVRAEGVDSAAEFLFEQKDIGGYEHELLTAFAAQIREGEPS